MDVVIEDDMFGMRAEHKTATIGSSGKKKKVYYVEGSAHQTASGTG
jgi:hypothetical protein